MIDKKAMVEAVIEARCRVATVEADLDAAKDDKGKAEAKLIELLETTGERSVKLETQYGLKLVVRGENLYVSVKKDDRETLLKWVDEECGRSDMIKQTIHNKMLQSFVNQRIKDGEPVPSFITTYFKPVLTVRNGSKE